MARSSTRASCSSIRNGSLSSLTSACKAKFAQPCHILNHVANKPLAKWLLLVRLGMQKLYLPAVDKRLSDARAPRIDAVPNGKSSNSPHRGVT